MFWPTYAKYRQDPAFAVKGIIYTLTYYIKKTVFGKQNKGVKKEKTKKLLTKNEKMIYLR